jgi:hypothetical protein
LWDNSTSQIRVFNRAAATTNVNNAHGALTTGAPIKLALSYSLDNFRSCRDGGTVVADTSAALPVGIDRFFLGVNQNGLFSGVRIKTLKYWNALKPDLNVFLQQVTA